MTLKSSINTHNLGCVSVHSCVSCGPPPTVSPPQFVPRAACQRPCRPPRRPRVPITAQLLDGTQPSLDARARDERRRGRRRLGLPFREAPTAEEPRRRRRAVVVRGGRDQRLARRPRRRRRDVSSVSADGDDRGRCGGAPTSWFEWFEGRAQGAAAQGAAWRGASVRRGRRGRGADERLLSPARRRGQSECGVRARRRHHAF